MQVNVTAIGKKSGAVKTIDVSDETFGREYNESLVHQVVVAYQLGARAGTRKQKTRAEVRGGGKKPWNQKGSGRARAGTIRSPLWRTGGVTFAARPQDHSQKVNKRMYRGAMMSILSELLRTERLIVVEDFLVDSPKTKNLLTQLKQLNLKDVLIVMHEVDEKLYLAARNVYSIGLCDTTSVDPVSLIGYSKVLITLPALQKIEEMLG